MKMKKNLLLLALLVFALMVVGYSSDVEPMYDDPTEDEQETPAYIYMQGQQHRIGKGGEAK